MNKDSIRCIVLCGGKGTRMQAEDKHKVCFLINGVPAIHRTIDWVMEAGVTSICVVVGALAGQVVETVGSRYDDVMFAYQPVPNGTGDAARRGIRLLHQHGVGGPVMVVMGDKIVHPGVIEKLIKVFEESGRAAAFVCQPREHNLHGGRIVKNESGELLGIVEERDVKKGLESGGKIGLAGVEYPAAWADETDLVNAAVYLFDQERLRSMLDDLESDNSQNEFYLTDVINRLCRETAAHEGAENVGIVVEKDPHRIMSFNTVDELLDVEERFLKATETTRVETAQPALRPAGEWLRAFEEMPNELKTAFRETYGTDESLLEERRQAHLSAVAEFVERYGSDRPAIVCRAPGRINLMGRHVEHRGGHINVMAINKEMLCVAAPRTDDDFHIGNVGDFEDRSFRMRDHLSMLDWKEWLGYLNAKETRDLVLRTQGEWENYVKAPVLRLQYTFSERRLKGMDMVFSGNLPVAAGLSSSSAIVVATAEAAVMLNGLSVTPQDFVDLCGEGEWFVGSRGGSGDHAAVKFSDRGAIARLGFFPFRVEGFVPFPEQCKLVIADSHVKAQKTTNAKNVFNQRIAEYEYSFMLFRHLYPEHRPGLERLRDLNPHSLGVAQSRLYEMLARIPEAITFEEILRILPKELHETINTIASSHDRPETYGLRSVMLYGIAECLRSARAGELLKSGDFEAFGNLMRVSHDGDRVVRYTNGEPIPYQSLSSDAAIEALIGDLRSEDPGRVATAQIMLQPGGYACSTEETDHLVDIANEVEGVLGAQLSGAGLGGCVMILVRDEALDSILRALNERYYLPRRLDSGITVCIPVKGSSVWKLN